MRSYIPNTDEERALMFKTISAEAGSNEIEALIKDIPENLRIKAPMKLPEALSEYELIEHIKELASENSTGICFMGGGVYDHYIPAAVDHLAGRQEFYTAYTPYQAEMSQGTLQAMFEYQSYIVRLTGMDLSNASVYDGATALAEAILMANSVNNRNEIVFCGAINPEYAETCRTYASFRGITIKEAPYDFKTGEADMEALKSKLNENTCAVIIQSPNYFGVIEDIAEVSNLTKAYDALLIASANPISLGLLKPPGELGADIAVGEGQPLGNPMSFGGPGFGYFACKKEYLRKMPGRIAGETTDKNGKRGFVLTMQAREQHIRREKATSNICSNQALNTLRATIYLSLLGKNGFRRISELCCCKAQYLYKKLLATGCFEPRFSGEFYNEFVLKYRGNIKEFVRKTNENGIFPGIDLSDIQGMENCILIAVTEKRTKKQMDDFAEILTKAEDLDVNKNKKSDGITIEAEGSGR